MHFNNTNDELILIIISLLCGCVGPAECVHANSVNTFFMFKNRIDKYLLRRVTHKIREGYTYNSLSIPWMSILLNLVKSCVGRNDNVNRNLTHMTHMCFIVPILRTWPLCLLKNNSV